MTKSIETPVWTPALKAALAVLLLLWPAVAYVVGIEGLLVNHQSSVMAPIVLSVIIPVALFLLAYGVSARFRRFVLSQDLRTLTMMQHWRVMGFVFLALYAFDVLPALFAWPAGIGDVAIGIAAIFMVARMDRDPNFVRSAGFVRFNLLGLLDFAVAVATAGLSAGAFPSLIANGITSAPMDVWPLNIFPSFIVPIFIILHLAVLLKVRHLRRAAHGPVGVDAALPAA